MTETSYAFCEKGTNILIAVGVSFLFQIFRTLGIYFEFTS
jgi:hypothetical protein